MMAAAHGINNIQRLMTDNAWAYRYSLRAVGSAAVVTRVR